MGTINLLENICSFGVLLLTFILRSRAAFSLGLITPSGYSPWGPKRVRHDLAIKQLFSIVSESDFSASHSTQGPMSHDVFQSGWWEQLGIAPFNLSRWFLQISAVMSHASSLSYEFQLSGSPHTPALSGSGCLRALPGFPLSVLWHGAFLRQ